MEKLEILIHEKINFSVGFLKLSCLVELDEGEGEEAYQFNETIDSKEFISHYEIKSFQDKKRF